MKKLDHYLPFLRRFTVPDIADQSKLVFKQPPKLVGEPEYPFFVGKMCIVFHFVMALSCKSVLNYLGLSGVVCYDHRMMRIGNEKA